MYVVDASVFAPLLILCGGRLVRVMRRVKFVLLDLTIYEVCNVFWKECVKFHRISMDEANSVCKISKALTRYADLHKITDLDVELILKIAVENNITFYDASYIALAHKLKVSIASEDYDIISVAPKYNVRVLKLHEFMKLIEE